MMWPIFRRQRAMAMKLVNVEEEDDGETEAAQSNNCHYQLQGQEEEDEDDETSSTGVSPTVITGLSSASPSNILVNQSSSEDQTSLTDAAPDTPAEDGHASSSSDNNMHPATRTADFDQGHVIERLVQESKIDNRSKTLLETETSSTMDNRHPSQEGGGSGAVTDPLLIKFN